MGNGSPDVRDRSALRTFATAGVAIGGLALLAQLMQRRGTGVDRTDQPAEHTDTPAGQGEQEGAAPSEAAPSVTTSVAPVDVDGHRPDISRFGLPALGVAVSLLASLGLEGRLWPEMSTLQTLFIAGVMLGCVTAWWVTLWWVDAPDRRSLISLLVVVASVAGCLYLSFRMQQLLLPDIPPGAVLFLAGYGVLLIFWWLGHVSRQRTTVRLLAAVVLSAGLLNTGIILRDRLQFQIPNVLLIAVLVIFLLGLFLWWHDHKEKGSRSELGAALLGGMVVAFAVLAFQWVLEQDREASAERRSLRIAIGMQSDLSGVDLSRHDLSGFYLKGKNLKNANLTDADLSEADLTEANLSGANLSGTDLTDATLSDSDLPRADLTGANLAKADLTNANLKRAILTRANLDSSNLARADLTRAHLTGANLTGAKVSGPELMTEALADSATIWPQGINREKFRIHLLAPGADLRNADLSGADLSTLDLSRAKLAGANLSEAKLSGADLSGADLSLARFDGADLTDTKLQRANLTGTNVADADLTGALADGATKWPKGMRPRSLGAYVLAPRSDLHGADLSDLDLSGVRLSGADLSGADLSYAVLSGADLSLARLGRADFNSARLDGADLTGAELSGADLSFAQVSRSTKWPQGFDPKGTDAYVLGPDADLQNADLAYTDLSGLDLRGANLSGADLSWANLLRTNLTGANLSDADLAFAVADSATRWPQGFDVGKSGAYILGPGVDLTDADLSYQHLSGVDLSGAHLSRIDLTGSDLTKVNFSGAHLTEIDLSEADLTGANLTGANLTSVRADQTTIWPQGFNTTAVGVEFSD